MELGFGEPFFLALLSSRLLHLPLFSLSFLFFFQVIIPNGIYINMCGNVKPPWVWELIELVCKAAHNRDCFCNLHDTKQLLIYLWEAGDNHTLGDLFNLN